MPNAVVSSLAHLALDAILVTWTTGRHEENSCSVKCSFPGHGARALPLEIVPVPGKGAEICARAPTKSYVQTERGLTLTRATGILTI